MGNTSTLETDKVAYTAGDYINDLKNCTSYQDYKVIYDKIKEIKKEYQLLLCKDRTDVINFGDMNILTQEVMTISVFDFYEEFKFNGCLLDGYPSRILFDGQLLSKKKRRNLPEYAINDFEKFNLYLSIFTANIFTNMDWSNVVLTGGSVLACLLNVLKLDGSSKCEIRRYFNGGQYEVSDLDFYIYGLNKEDALVRLQSFVDYLIQEIPFDVKVVRSVWSVTIVSQYPFRHIQIIARLHANISELLSLIDIDCTQLAYDGKKVYCSFDCYRSLITRANFIDCNRRSLTTDMRYYKYSKRGFSVVIPDLDDSRIDYSIIFKPYSLLSGCSKLILLSYIEDRKVRNKIKDKMEISLGESSPRKKRLTNDQTSDYSAVNFDWGDGVTIYSVINRLESKLEKVNNTKRVKLRGGYHYHTCVIGANFNEAIDFICEDCPKPKIDDEDIQYMVTGKFQFALPYGEEGSRSAFHKFDSDTFFKDTYHSRRIIHDSDFTHIIDNFNGKYFDYLGRDIWECAMLHKLYNHIPIMFEKQIRISTNYNGLNLIQQAIFLDDKILVGIFLEYNSKQLEILKKDSSYDKYINKIHTLLMNWPSHLIEKPKMMSLKKSIGLYKLRIVHLAILLGNVEILELLLNNGGQITNLNWKNHYPRRRESVYLLCGFLYKYNESKGREMLKFLMSKDIKFNCESNQSNTIYSLIHYNLLDFTRYILKEYPKTRKYADDFFYKNYVGRTPLLYSLDKKKWGFTKLFLEYNVRVVFTEEEIRLIHSINEDSDIERVKKCYDALKFALDGDTPIDIVELLIKKGCGVKFDHYYPYLKKLTIKDQYNYKRIRHLGLKEFMSNYLNHKNLQGEKYKLYFDEKTCKFIELFKPYFMRSEDEQISDDDTERRSYFYITHPFSVEGYNPMELFEAVFDGDVEKIKEVTSREGDNIIYIQSYWEDLSIIQLALLTKQFSLLPLLIEIGIEQYRIKIKDELEDYLIDSDDEVKTEKTTIQSYAYSVCPTLLFSSIEVPSTMFPEFNYKEKLKLSDSIICSKSVWEYLYTFGEIQLIFDILNLIFRYLNKYKSEVISIYSEVFIFFFEVGDSELIKSLYKIHRNRFIKELIGRQNRLIINSKLFDFFFNHLYDIVAGYMEEIKWESDGGSPLNDLKFILTISAHVNSFHNRVIGEDYFPLIKFIEENNCQDLLENETILSYFQKGVEVKDDALILYLLDKYKFKCVELSFGTLEIQRYIYKLLLKGDNKKILIDYIHDDDKFYYLLLNLPYVAVVYVDDINWEMFHDKCYNYHTTYILHILPEWYKIYRSDLDILVKRIISLFKYQANYENFRGYTVVETCRLYFVQSLLTVNTNVKQYTSVNYLGRLDQELCSDSPRVELNDQYITNYFMFITNEMNGKKKLEVRNKKAQLGAGDSDRGDDSNSGDDSDSCGE